MYGKIVKAVSGFYYVRMENYTLIECKAKGSFKHNDVTPLVGDDVQFEVTDGPNRKGLIVDIYPRFNELKRPQMLTRRWLSLQCGIRTRISAFWTGSFAL